MNEYVIQDLNEFILTTKHIVYAGFADKISSEDELIEKAISLNPEQLEEVDMVLSDKECIAIINAHAKTQRHKFTKEKRYIINDESFEQIISAFHLRMVSNILMSLVKKGLIESSFDETINDFVFWVKENDNDSEN